MEYEYDTSGVYFCYFLLSMLGLWLLPTTLTLLQNADNSKKTTEHSQCHCQQCVTLSAKRRVASQRTFQNPRLSKTTICVVIGWLLFIPLLLIVLTTPTEVQKVLFDPYDILGVPLGASPVDIKKQYKQQSLKW